MDELENLFHLFDSQKKDLLHLIQVYPKPLGPEEVHYFLTSMDKICSHGLKNEKLGYWPFVQEFTHKAGVSYISDMKNCVTGHGRGRAWLLLALSEGTLEFYFTSFIGHASQRARHYRPGAFLRDERRLKELVLGLAELMAADITPMLRPEEYDLDKHICPPPSTSETAGEFPSWAVSPCWPPTGREPLQWTHTGGGRNRARRSRHSSAGSSPRSSRSSARSRRRRSPAGAGGRAPTEVKDVRRDSDTAPTDSACVTMESDPSGVSALSSAVTTPVSERSESIESAAESAQSAASAEFGESGTHGESGTADVPLVDNESHQNGNYQRPEREAMTGSATPTVADLATPTPAPVTISASSPMAPSDMAPPTFAAVSEDVPSPIAPAPSPSDQRRELSPVPMSPIDVVLPPGQCKGAALSEDISRIAEEVQEAHPSQAGSSAGGAIETVSRGVPSGGCTPSEQADETNELLQGDVEHSNSGVQHSSPHLDRVEASGASCLSQLTLSKQDGTPSSVAPGIRDDNSNVTSGPTSAGGDIQRPSTAGDGPSTAQVARPNGPAPGGKTDSRRVSSSDALAVEEAMRRLRTDPPGPGRSSGRPPPQPPPTHIHPSGSSATLRPRPPAPRLPQAHSEVTLRRRALPLAPDKRVTWAGTDRETAAVAAMLPPEPPRGERGAPEGQEDPARLSSVSSLTRVSSQLSVGSSCLSSGSERGLTARPAVRQTRLYEPAALGAAPPLSNGQTEKEIAQELSQGRRRKRAAYTALVEIDHCKAVQLMVSFFEGDEMAYTGFKVLFGDHHAMRACLLVLTSYRLLLLRLSTYRRLRRAARRRPRPADPLSPLRDGAQSPTEELPQRDGEGSPYLQDAAFQYCSITSIKVAFHGQAIALQRPDGSYSRWIWPGDRAETDLLISHVTRAFERCRLRPLVPQVYTSEAHRQQYLKEIRYRETEPQILYASLVYFEDFAVPGETPKLSDQLMYKADSERRWSVGHFVLWDADLLVYPSAAALRGGGAPLDRWPLPAVTSCRRLTELSRPHQLELAAPGRCLTLAAPDAATCSRWATVVREIMELSVPSQLPSPRPRCCVLSGRSLYIIEEMAFTGRLAPEFELCPYGHLVQASGPLKVLGAANADSHGTVHLEFDTVEAAESLGSWRLYFVTLTEQRAFLAALMDTYRKRCKAELTVGQISHHMREVCLSGSRYVRTRWDGLVDT